MTARILAIGAALMGITASSAAATAVVERALGSMVWEE